MTASIISSSFYTNGGNVTLLGTGTNRCVIAIPLARSGATSNLSSFTLDGVEGTVQDINYNGGGQKLISGVGLWIGADDPGAGTFAVSQTWPAGANNSCGLVIELVDVHQGSPINTVTHTGVGNTLNPVSVSHTLSGEAGELGIAFAAFVDDSFSNDSGFINSTDGHTLVDSSRSGNVWLGVYSDAVIAGASETYAFQTSQRGDTALITDSTIASAFAVRGIDATAPVLTLPTGTQTGETTASGTVTTDEANGTLHYLVSTNASELAATIRAGSANQTVSATGVQNVTVTGLTGGTTYYLHYVHDDTSANASNVVSSSGFTTTAPTIKVDSITSGTIRSGDTVTLNLSNSSGSGQVLSTSAGNIALASESAAAVTFIVPELILFGDRTLRHGQIIPLTLTDGGDSDSINMVVEIPAVGVVEGLVTSIDPDGIYANDPDLQIGDTVFFQVLTGDPVIDIGSGLSMVTQASTARYAAYDTSWYGFEPVNYADPNPDTPPTITGHPSPASIQEGDTASVQFTASATSTPAATVQWQKDTKGDGIFANLSGETSPSISIAGNTQTVSSNDGDQYRAVFTNITGPSSTNPAVLTITPNLVPVVTPPSDIEIFFPTGDAGLPKDNIELLNWEASASVSDLDTLIATANLTAYVDPIPAGVYTVPFSATDSGGLTGTASAELTITETPAQTTAPSITLQPVDSVVQEGAGSATFTVAAGGSPDPTVQWQKDTQGNGVFVNIVGATSRTLTITGQSVSAANNNGEQYRAIFTNGTSPDATTSIAVLSVTSALTGGVISGTLTDWDLAPYASQSSITISLRLTIDGPVIGASRTFATDTAGNYAVNIPEAVIGTLYYVSKESADGAITSLQKQVATA